MTKIKAVFESLNIQKESEIYFFYLLMETRPKLYENKEVARRALEPHKKNNSDVYAATEVFIRVFQKKWPRYLRKNMIFFLIVAFQHIYFVRYLSIFRRILMGMNIFVNLKNIIRNCIKKWMSCWIFFMKKQAMNYF